MKAPRMRLLAGSLLFVYGFIVFADEGASELIDGGTKFGGNAVIRSPLILGSEWGFHVADSLGQPYSGTAAVYGFLIALLGFLVLMYRPRESEWYDHTGALLRAFVDVLILAAAWCLAWTVLLSIFQPAVMGDFAMTFLQGTPVTNLFVQRASIGLLAFFLIIRVLVVARQRRIEHERKEVELWRQGRARSEGSRRASALPTSQAGPAALLRHWSWRRWHWAPKLMAAPSLGHHASHCIVTRQEELSPSGRKQASRPRECRVDDPHLEPVREVNVVALYLADVMR